MVAVNRSSSLEHSETSATPPMLTAPQRSMHAPDFDAWQNTHSRLRFSQDEQLQKRGARIAACCCCPVFSVGANAALKLSPGFCRDRLCPTCARRRSRRTFHDICAAVARMDSPRFITLTQKDKNEPIFISLARLRAGFRKLREHAVWHQNVRGGVYSIEVTRNADTKTFHCHLHIIAEGTFIAQARLSAAWKEVTGDSFIVDIRAIHSKAQTAGYITKYISKPASITSWPAAAFEAYARDMAGVRMVHTFGNQHDRATEPGDDGCVVQRVEVLCTSATILRRLRMLCPHAAHAVHLINRHGGTFRRALGLPQPPEDEQPEPLTPAEREELIGHLRAMMTHQPVSEIPRPVWRMADLRCDECPWR